MKKIVFLFGLLTSGFCHATVSVPQARTAYQPKAYTATYLVFRNGKDLGNATVKFSSIGNGRWELASNTVGTGIAAIAGVQINERSLLRWNEGKPETVNYSFSQITGWKNKQRTIKVNAQSKTIASQDNEKSYTMKYEPGVLDRHAINVAVMQDLSQGLRGDLHYTVADRDELHEHLYRVIGNEKTETALGVLNSIKVQRIRETANGRITTLWLGSDKQFVPIRIEQKEGDGDVIEMRITGLR
jgi:Protein of unknown function (DUF3108)